MTSWYWYSSLQCIYFSKGIDEFKDELVELTDYLKNPKKYTEAGAKIPKGILLVGPPGTGICLI